MKAIAKYSTNGLVGFLVVIALVLSTLTLPKPQAVSAQSGGTNVGCTLPGTWSNNWFLNARNEILASWSGTITPSHTTNRAILFKSASTEATNGFETANQWYFMAVNDPKFITINGAGSTGANLRIQANFGNSEKALVKLDANGNSLGLGGGSQSIDIITDNICGATNSTLSLASTTSFSWREGFPAMADESLRYLPMTIYSPPPENCEWNEEILASDPACSECEWNDGMWSGDEECGECEYIPDMWQGDPECVAPVCEYNPEISPEDPYCVPVDPESSDYMKLQLFAAGLTGALGYVVIRQFRWRA